MHQPPDRSPRCSPHRSPLLAALVACAIAAGSAAQQSPQDAKAALVAGNQRFVAGKSTAQPLGPGVRRTLARGQSPYAIVLSCADSRVPPEHVFNAGLGELFVIRVAGNCVDPESIASIEYAAEHLGTQLLVVLGHERCGAVAAAVDLQAAAAAGKPAAAESPSLQQLLEALEPSVRRALAEDLGGRELNTRVEEDNAQRMAVEVLRRSALLRQFEKLGRFQALPARYHLESGEVEWLTPRPLPPETTAAAAPLHAAAPSMAPHVALRLLQAGHRRFLGEGRPIGDISPERRTALAAGQQPYAIVVTCADSRVPPEHVFDAGLGELFVIRVAGNIVNADVLASVEYAAAHTGAPLLVVLGHSACGAVTAAADHGDDPELTPNLRALVERLQPAVERARRGGGSHDELIDRAVRANAQRFVTLARQQSGILRELEHQGRFTMLSAVYDLASGDIDWLKDDEAVDLAAPMGESAPAHGASHAAPAPAPHGAPAHGAHGADLDWADEPPAGHVAPAPPAPSGHAPQHGGDTAAAPGHDAHADDGHAGPAQGDPHAADHAAPAAHGEHDPHAEHGEQAGHGEHGESHAAAPTTPPAGGSSGSPVMVLGITGMVSLLAAAMIALKGR